MKRRPWTRYEVAVLRARYPHMETGIIAAQLVRTRTGVFQKAMLLGIEKSPEYLSTPTAGRFNGTQGGACRFPPGHRPWNTGRKGWDAGGRCRETQFKAGNRVWNHKPVGTERENGEGYIEVKTSEPDVWELKQRVVWKRAHGLLTRGDYIRFVDGNRKNFALSNLSLITRQDNMERNTIHRLPEPLKQVIRLRGKLNRAIERTADA
jgi:hypothetical protein